MRNRVHFLILTCVCLGSIVSLAAQDSGIWIKNSFTVRASLFKDDALPDAELVLAWKPELFAQYFPDPAIRLSTELSLDNRISFVIDSPEMTQRMDFDLYRAWAAASYQRTELKGGLQHIRMGVAQIYRPLMWFDRLVPGTMTQETEGVEALTLTHFFPNPELRFWLLPGKDQTKGAELLSTHKDSWEFGGRIGYLNPLGNTGLSYHQRQVSDPFSEQAMTEYRLGLDQRVDGFLGGWLEAAANLLEHELDIPTPYGIVTYPQHSLSLTLGGDYTFDIGNGLYLLLEQNMQLQGERPVTYSNTRYQVAIMLSYPLGLLDGLHLLASYDYKEQRGLGMLAWRRTYDYLSWELSLGLDNGYPAELTRTPSLNLTINYDL